MFRLWTCISIGLILAAAIPSAAVAADTGTPPATVPATAPAPPHIAVVPPGFHLLTVGEHKFFCLPEDDEWVKAAAQAVRPATRPSTMPSDLLVALVQRRDELIRAIASDAGLQDTKQIVDVLDNSLIPSLNKLQTLHPTVYYMPVTKKLLATLMEGGWTDPRYEYLRFSNDVHYTADVALSVDRQTDDLVMWVEIADDDSPAVRAAKTDKLINEFETGYGQWSSLLAQSGTRRVFSQLMRERIMAPVKLPQSLNWFTEGVASVYGIKYATMICGTPRADLMAALLRGDPRNPLPWRPLDLLNPPDPASLRPDTAPLYIDAAAHKGAYVVQQWTAKGGDGVLAKAIPALLANPPKNAAELASTLKAATGVDVTPYLGPDFSTP